MATAVLGAGILLTALSWLLPGFDVAYGAAGMHIGLEAVTATVSVVVGVVAASRFVRTGQLRDLLAAVVFGVMVVENAFLLVVPKLLEGEQITPFSVWSSTATTAASTVLLLATALAGERRVRNRRSALAVAIGGSVLSLAAVAGIVLVFQHRLPLAVPPGLSPVAERRQAFTGEVAILAVQGAVTALLLAAGVRLLASRRSDRGLLGGWLGPALIVAGLASFNYVLFPSLYSDWVYAGDILRLGFCVILTCGLVAEIRATAHRLVELAVLEERRRLARDLHDGVAQELAFIVTEVGDLPRGLHPSLPWIRAAAERGLHESRRAIAALTLPLDQPLAVAVAEEVDELTARAGVAARLELDHSVQVAPERREAILRVVREAVTNAIRHGGATVLDVTLERNGIGLVRLRVSDNGCGFEQHAGSGSGFGLTSMRERVEAAGGRLGVESAPESGTTIQAEWEEEAPRSAPRRRSALAGEDDQDLSAGVRR